MNARERFYAAMVALLGKPVLWSMKGPDAFDCSGSVSYALMQAGGPDLRYTVNAQGYHDRTRPLGPAEAPLPGDLVLYGSTDARDVEHVAVYDEFGGVISADGATSHLDPKALGFEKALALTLANPSHRVRRHNTPRYRDDTKYIAVHKNTLLDALDGVCR